MSLSWYGAFEFAVIAALILFSLWRVTGRITPKLRAKAHKHVAAWLMSAGKPSWMARLGTRLAPAEAMAAGCGSGCGSCGGCEPASTKDQPVVWHAHR
ncbi:MAG: hypothetical protein JWP52_1392 [Rhizobacter sp.]|nr:hypothetical protein [Rhizobacter sp.]